MAVYTDIEEKALKEFLGGYELGTLVGFEGITEGIENSNFRLTTSSGSYILTLFEKRMNPAELPWFLGYMDHLAHEGVSCPLPVKDRDGRALRTLAGRPAVIVTFLPGKAVSVITPDVCEELGRAMALLHQKGEGYRTERPNSLDAASWKPLLAQCRSNGDEAIEALIAQTSQNLDRILEHWPTQNTLPRGQIHADLFPDNVFFRDGKVSGLIDFYFACTDFLAYDLAICLNAWCFEAERQYRPERAAGLIKGYETVRPLTREEKAVLPVLCQGAAVRFLLTRLYDWVHTPEGANVVRKDPWAYQIRLKHFMGSDCV
ncbi:homoserine kinase [Acetobacteraceae bacterium ESL0709]|nr:homoserine kinase [Acetobacteraceae bacterium ESL0697]MDF7678415.1 homoserine kinase [Acetobacteraceae bacterium ESL0709]